MAAFSASKSVCSAIRLTVATKRLMSSAVLLSATTSAPRLARCVARSPDAKGAHDFRAPGPCRFSDRAGQVGDFARSRPHFVGVGPD
jgi:hypothetical protein